MKLILLAVVVLLAGCSVVFVPTYHETEFNELVTIAALSARGSCDAEQNELMLGVATHLLFYAELTPNNTTIYDGVKVMGAAIEELSAKPQPIPQAYCSLKLRIINMMARSLGAASGGKPK